MRTAIFTILALLFPLVTFSQNSLGKIQDNTNLALPSSYNFVEYVFPEPDDEGSCTGVINSTASINEIFFSQLHRKSINHPFHFLIGHRPALFQLHLTGSGLSPDVKVEGFIDGVSLGEKCLSGPQYLFQDTNTDVANFDDYFSVTLPKSWMRENLNLKVTIGSNVTNISSAELKVGPYTEMNLIQFDLDVLDYNTQDPYFTIIDNFIQEIASAFPASVIRFGKFPETIKFPEIIASNGTEQLVRLTQISDKIPNGITSDGSINSIALQFLKSIQQSTGDYLSTFYYGNTLNLAPGGWGGNKNMVSMDYDDVFVHELGHTFGLPHWGNSYKKENPSEWDFSYPYGGDPANYNGTNGNGGGRGESWNFIQHTYEFIDPTCKYDGRGVSGTETSDAMQRNNFCLEQRTNGPGPWDGFGDFSALAMHRFLIGYSETYTGKVNYRNNQEDFQFRKIGGYPTVSLQDGKRVHYRDPIQQQSLSILPTEERYPWPGEEKIEQDVYLIYGTAHENQSQANIVYEPIKYQGTLPPLLDPTDPATFDRLKSSENHWAYRIRLGSPRDITLKVTYKDGEILHLINPNQGYTRYADYSWGYHIWRNDLMNFSIVVPGDKEIIKVELYNRPFLFGASNYNKEGNINYYTSINSQNFMDDATFQTKWVGDLDSDGVADDIDQCLDTSPGQTVDSNGCSDSQKDTDGDGVTDDKDTCANTPSGETVDSSGCPIPLFIESISFINKVYPNPTENDLVVELKDNSTVKKIVFIDFNGKSIVPNRVIKTDNRLDINISNLKDGIYVLEIITNKEVNKVKVIVER